MATEITIPHLGHTMTKAKILKWFKAVGDRVEIGEPLLEIETDKVNYVIEAEVSGVVKAILASVDDEVPVAAVVAVIASEDEEIDVGSSLRGEKEKAVPVDVQPEKRKEVIPTIPRTEGNRVLASPVAKKMAREKGIDLSSIKGSGRSGRIRRADVERYISEVRPTRIEPPPFMPPEVSEIIHMDTMRRTIANRLTQSFHDVPHFNLCMEVDMTEAQRLKDRLHKKTEAQFGISPSLNDIFIKAVAITLRDHPRLNARLKDNQIEILGDINIGLAVALDDGLIVPAIERADQKRLWQIAMERKDLVERARQNRLSLDELERGTFTVSNLGMYDIVFFTSILNPPQTGILSIGKTLDRPVVRDGNIVIRPIMEITLAVDHRVVDGAVAAKFLQDLKDGLEDPYLWI
ncbi:MAG: dihydrolipoamide acetyltransferase family protein [Pseudomonadota bacterium]